MTIIQFDVAGPPFVLVLVLVLVLSAAVLVIDCLSSDDWFSRSPTISFPGLRRSHAGFISVSDN
jgi:hypothetical protein